MSKVYVQSDWCALGHDENTEKHIRTGMKNTLIAILALLPFVLNAQIQKERRVYYLDCSYSMVTNGIWDEVRNNLKTAIDNVSDETTELMVIPFAFDNKYHENLNAFTEVATDNGKTSLKAKIDGLKTDKSTMTYHSDPLKDFYKSRVNNKRVTYMFFMTDGQNEEKQDKFKPLLEQWGGKYGNTNVYGFYVMLHDLAKDSSIDNIISKQDHLWKVETADVNINLIRMQSNAIFNARSDKFFEVPIYGNTKGMSFNVQFERTSVYKVLKVEVLNGKLRVYVSFTGDVFHLPVSIQEKLSVSMSGGGKFDFLVTECIDVTCESKPEKSLKISVR
jgi:hypothetical protein